MKANQYYKSSLLLFAIIFFALSCEREYDNPWDVKATLDPNVWAPQNLQIEDISITEKKITWTYNGDYRFEGFKLDRKKGNEPWHVAYKTLSKESRSWNDTEIIPDPGLTYSYRLYAFAGQNSSAQNDASINAELPAPTNLQITPNSISSITLFWQDNSNGEEGFKIDRKINSSTWELNYASVANNQTSNNENNVDWQANDYTYRVYAFYGQYNSSAVESKMSWPQASTTPASNIGSNSATSGGSVTIQGNYSISARGICYSSTQNPDLSGPHTIDGNGAGNYTSNVSGLNSQTHYWVCAYATIDFGTIYGSPIEFTTTPAIGETYAGGMVFFLNGNGGGLVCAPNEQSPGVQWGCSGTIIGVTETIIGAGASNTAAIVAGCSESDIAAQICNDLMLNSYNDWFLPSKDELNLIYENLKEAGIGGFADDDYWSSSEDVSYSAWDQYFTNGSQGLSLKYGVRRVRAVRGFNN